MAKAKAAKIPGTKKRSTRAEMEARRQNDEMLEEVHGINNATHAIAHDMERIADALEKLTADPLNVHIVFRAAQPKE